MEMNKMKMKSLLASMNISFQMSAVCNWWCYMGRLALDKSLQDVLLITFYVIVICS